MKQFSAERSCTLSFGAYRKLIFISVLPLAIKWNYLIFVYFLMKPING